MILPTWGAVQVLGVIPHFFMVNYTHDYPNIPQLHPEAHAAYLTIVYCDVVVRCNSPLRCLLRLIIGGQLPRRQQRSSRHIGGRAAPQTSDACLGSWRQLSCKHSTVGFRKNWRLSEVIRFIAMPNKSKNQTPIGGDLPVARPH